MRNIMTASGGRPCLRTLEHGLLAAIARDTRGDVYKVLPLNNIQSVTPRMYAVTGADIRTCTPNAIVLALTTRLLFSAVPS